MKKINLFLTLTLLSLSGHDSSAATVESVSKESFAQYGKEDAYWVVTVTCDNQSKHIVQRKTDADTWCIKGNNSLCDDDKSIATKNACSNANIPKVAKVETVQTTTNTPTRTTQTFAEREAQEKAAIEKKIREAELRIQQQIFIEDSIISLRKEISSLEDREQWILGRITEIDEIIQSSDEEDE